MIAQIIGGVGLFLLGMILLTDGLKSLAGDALRAVLERFVRGPSSGLTWGTLITAIVQSSSATTLMTIGFVSAGLLSFSQSIGVILGANLGTTSTGWIVSTVGLKFSMSAVALPVIGIGAVMRLVGQGRMVHLGVALAGFGLIFVGIDTLQAGMQGLAARIDPARFPGMTVLGIPALVVIGAIMTVIMQSSSAAVATTLAALHTGALGIEQAAVLVIGQNIGTTVKAALASIGASIPARRTALAHILFNIVTGVLALALLPVFLWLSSMIASRVDGDPGAVSLAAFHTAFNLLGVLAILPFVSPFARLITRLIPERKPELARNLDASVANIPSVAVEAVRRTTMQILQALVKVLQQQLAPEQEPKAPAAKLNAIASALDETSRFLGLVSTESASSAVFARHLSAIHAVDHVTSLLEACRDPAPLKAVAKSEELRATIALLAEHLGPVQAWLRQEGESEPPVDTLERMSRSLAEVRRGQRAYLLQQAATRTMTPRESVEILDAFLWLDRVGFHLWRTAYHLKRDPQPATVEAAPKPQIVASPR